MQCRRLCAYPHIVERDELTPKLVRFLLASCSESALREKEEPFPIVGEKGSALFEGVEYFCSAKPVAPLALAEDEAAVITARNDIDVSFFLRVPVGAPPAPYLQYDGDIVFSHVLDKPLFANSFE